MTQSAPTKLMVSRILHETVQVTDHDRESLRLRKFDSKIWNFVSLDTEHTLSRSTIIAKINAMHHVSPNKRLAA